MTQMLPANQHSGWEEALRILRLSASRCTPKPKWQVCFQASEVVIGLPWQSGTFLGLAVSTFSGFLLLMIYLSREHEREKEFRDLAGPEVCW